MYKEMLSELNTGVVLLCFEKLPGFGEGIREMPCTTNKKFTGFSTPKQDPASNVFVMWSLDKNAWRDVRKDTIKSWRKLPITSDGYVNLAPSGTMPNWLKVKGHEK